MSAGTLFCWFCRSPPAGLLDGALRRWHASAMSFEERTDHEQGFAQVFDDQIQPAIHELAGMQQRLRKRRRRAMTWLATLVLAALAVIGAAVAGGLAPVPGLWEPALIILAALVLLAAAPAFLLIWARPSTQVDQLARHRLMPIIADHLGVTYERDVTDPPEAVAFGKRGLITRANFATFQDVVTARVASVSVTMLIADFGRAGDAKAADWNGLLLQAELNDAAPAAIRIGGDQASRCDDGFVIVPVALSTAPELTSEDPEAATKWLTSSVLECLANLSARFDPDHNGNLRAMIDGATFRLSVRNPATPVLPVPNPEDDAQAEISTLRSLIADAALPLDVAEAFSREANTSQA